MNASTIRNLNPIFTRFAPGLCLALSLLAYNAGAAAVYQWWDNNTTSAATSGTWDTTTANWSSTSALTASTAAFGSGNYAAFAAGSSTIASMTITVPGTVTCAGISNSATGASVTSLTFSGAGPITLASGADGFYCGTNASANMIINTPITGAGQLVQHANGSLYLYGNNSYTGGTSLTGGQLIYYNNNNSFGFGTISINGTSGAILNNSLPEVAVVFTNAVSFPTANYTLNVVGGLPVAGAPGTTFAGSFTLPSSGNTLIYTGGSGTPGETIEISGPISGTSGLMTADYGVLELAGTNTYTGNTAIIAPGTPTLMIVGAGLLGSGNYAGAITNNGTFFYNSSATQTLAGAISGSGPLTKNGSGQLTLTGTNTYTGGTTNAAGMLVVSGTGVIPGNVTVTGGTVDANSADSLLGGVFTVTGGTLELDNPTAISNQFAIVTLPAASTNSMNLNFSGTCSILALNFGGTSMADGTWGAPGSGAAHTSSAFTGTGILSVAVSSGVNYYWDANGSDAGDAHSDLGGGSGNWDNSTSDWWVSGGADSVWQAGYAANFGGTAGTVTVAADVTPGSINFTTPGYVVTNSGSSMIIVTNPVTTITIPAGTTTISSPIAGQGVVVSGPGTLVLSGANTYTAGTTVTNQATVSVNTIADSGTSEISTAPFTFAGGTLAYTGSGSPTTTRHMPGAPGTTNGVVVPAGVNLFLNSQINGTAGWVINKTGPGTLTLGGTADNAYLGMNILTGEVICDKTVAGHALGGPVNVSSGALIQLSGSGYGQEIYSGSTAPVSIYNGGQLDLNGQNNTLYNLALTGSGIGGVGAVINSATNTVSVLTTPVSLQGNTVLGGPGSITFAPGVGDVISNNYSITWAGTGATNILTLAGTNTFYGGVNINPGTTVQIGTATAASGAGTGPVTIGANGTLLVNIAGNTLAIPVVGGPSTSVDVVPTSAANTGISGDWSGFTGQLNCPASASTAKVQFTTSGTFTINPAATINVTNGGTLYVANHNVVVPCTLNLFGTGNSEAYGALRLEAGALVSGPVNLHGNTTMGNGQSGATVLATISGVISSVGGTYGITYTAEPGTIQLMGANTYTGPTTLNGNILQLDSPEIPGTSGPLGNPAVPANSIVMSGGGLQFSSVNNHDYSGRFSTTTANAKFSFDVNGQTVTLANPLVSSGGALTLQSSIAGGTLVLSGANTFTGPTTNSSGTIRLAVAENPGVSGPLGTSAAVISRAVSGAVPGGILMAGGTLQYTPANTGDYSGRFVTNASQAFNLDVNGQNVSYASALISPSGTLTLSSTTPGGSLTLNGTNYYTGATTINPGATLAISGAGELVNTNGGGFYSAAINDQGTFVFGSSSNQVLLGAVTGNGSLIVSGTGMLTLSNSANAYYGGTTVSNGTLNITNTGAIAGNVTVAGGVLMLDNATALLPSAILSLPASPAAGMVNLNFSGVQTVGSLMFGTTNMAPGTYGAIGNASATYQNAAFTGAGILNVAASVAYWDPSPSLDASPGNGGSGSWDNSTTDWWVSGSTDSVWSGTNIAYFAGTSGTVSVNANVSASGLLFATSNYVVSGSSTLTLLDYTNTGTPVISIPGGNTTISCPVASAVSSNSVIVNGPGTLNLTADNEGMTNNLVITGGATVNAATIADAGGGASAVGSGTNLTLLNGNLAFTGAQGGQSISTRSITLTGTISNTITVPTGDYLEIDGTIHQVSESAPQGLVFNGGGTLVMGGATDNSGLDLAINSGTVIINKSSASNVHGLGGGTSTIGSGGELQLSGSGGDDLYSGCILTIASGGTLDLNGQNELGSSTLTMQGTGIGGLGAIINSGGLSLFTNSSIVLAGNTTIGGSGPITLMAVISGIGPVLTYSGVNGLTLSATNTWSGGLNVAPGSTVTLNAPNAAGSGPVTLESGGSGPGSGGTLYLPLSASYGSTYDNSVSGDSTTTINIAMPGTANAFIYYGLTNFTGTINVGIGNGHGQCLFSQVNNEAYPINPNATLNINAGATLDFQAPCTANPAQVIVNGIGNNIYGSLRMDACNQEGNVLLNAPGATCQIGDGNTPPGASTISGVISDGGNGYGFTKVGAAGNNIILTGVNTYTGPTVVSNGILSIAGSGSIATSSGLSLVGGTTFDVSGVNGGVYSLGNSQGLTCLGTATVGGDITLTSGTPLALQCTNIGTSLIVTNGTLTLNNNPINVTVYNSLGAQIGPVPGVYPLISTTASITGTGPGFVGGSIASSVLTVANLNPTFNSSLAISNNTLYMIIAVSTPTIIGQLPVSAGGPATALYAGANPNFSVQAVGLAPLQYMWYTNNVLVGYATGASLTLTNVENGPLSTYCIVSNTPSYTPAQSLTWTANVTNDPTAPYPSLVVAAKPLGYWRLNEAEVGSGDDGVIAEDYLGNNDGIYTNVLLGAAGYSSNTDTNETSMQLGDYGNSDADAFAIPNINFESPAGTSPTFSVEAWVNGYQQTQDAGIVSLGYGGGGEEFDLDTGNDSVSHGFRFFVRDASGATHASTSTIIPQYGTWHHLVGVCDESNGVVTLYVDGLVASSGSGSIAPRSGILSSIRNMIIGARPSNSTANNNLQFQGNIDDVAVYNYALSSSQVVSHYVSAGVPPAFAQVPATTVNADAGQSLVLPATAIGTPPLLYVWADQTGGTNLVSGVINSNEIGASLTISNVPGSWNGDNLLLTVSNAYGETNITVSLNVAAFLQASLVPNTNLSLIAGESYTFTAAASGSVPISYQWSANGVPVGGATSDTFTALAALGNTAYSCLVSNQSGTTNLSVTLTGLPYLTLDWNGGGWTANQVGTYSSVPFNSGALTLTDGGGSQARSDFFSAQQYIGAFEASFTYQAGGSAAADGAAFVLQNDPRGAAAVGGDGGNLGVSGITPSADLELNLYNGGTEVRGYSFKTNGLTGASGANGNYTPLGSINLNAGNPVNFDLYYSQGVLSMTATDTVAGVSFSTNLDVGDLTALLGGNFAYVGFAGGDGGSTSVQTISNFSFFSLMDLEAQSSGTNLVLSWPNEVTLFQLQSAGNLTAPVWVNVNNPVTVTNNMNEVTVPATGVQQFYRLQLQ